MRTPIRGPLAIASKGGEYGLIVGFALDWIDDGSHRQARSDCGHPEVLGPAAATDIDVLSSALQVRRALCRRQTMSPHIVLTTQRKRRPRLDAPCGS